MQFLSFFLRNIGSLFSQNGDTDFWLLFLSNLLIIDYVESVQNDKICKTIGDCSIFLDKTVRIMTCGDEGATLSIYSQGKNNFCTVHKKIFFYVHWINNNFQLFIICMCIYFLEILLNN